MGKRFLTFSLALLLMVSLATVGIGATQSKTSLDAGAVNIRSEDSDRRIAPGEFLPISIKLVNFGSQKRIDVVINYQIFDKGNHIIYAETETVAVETTASFIKRIQLPYTIGSGAYTSVATLHYPHQEQPAVSKFPFLVEKKIGGIFKSDLIIYAIFFVSVSLVTMTATYFLSGWRRKYQEMTPILPYDYSDKPRDEIIYYEILNNVISKMRMRIGDDAIRIVQGIPDLKINPSNGTVIKISQNPAKIIALLIFRYEQLMGQSLSFGLSLRKTRKKSVADTVI